MSASWSRPSQMPSAIFDPRIVGQNMFDNLIASRGGMTICNVRRGRDTAFIGPHSYNKVLYDMSYAAPCLYMLSSCMQPSAYSRLCPPSTGIMSPNSSSIFLPTEIYGSIVAYAATHDDAMALTGTCKLLAKLRRSRVVATEFFANQALGASLPVAAAVLSAPRALWDAVVRAVLAALPLPTTTTSTGITTPTTNPTTPPSTITATRALLRAIRGDASLPVVEALLRAGASPTLEECDDGFCTDECKSEILDKTNHEHPNAIFVAARAKRLDVIDAMIAHMGLDAAECMDLGNMWGETALMWSGDAATAEGLLARGADVNAMSDLGTTALIEAARKGLLDVVETLLEKGADKDEVNDDGHSAVNAAVEGGHMDVVACLLRAGAAPGDAVAFAQTDEVLTALLDVHGLSATAPMAEFMDMTPLMYAASRHKVSFMDILCSRGARIYAIGPRGETALMHAVGFKGGADFEATIDFILARAPPDFINERDTLGETALHHAASLGAYDAVVALLARGADPLIADASGVVTPREAALSNARAHAESPSSRDIPRADVERIANEYARVVAALDSAARV